MAITIRGIRITSLTVARSDDGADKITADYQLISSLDKVLAKESLSSKQSYGENVFTPSPQTTKALADAVALYKADVETSLGITAE